MAYNQRGIARQVKGDLEGAISDFSRALKLNPRHAGVYANRGLARLLQGKKPEAEKDFANCLALDPSLKPFLERRVAEVTNRP